MAVEIYSSSVLVSSAALVTSETLKTGKENKMIISSGGTAVDTTVSSGGFVDVENGGLAVRTTVSSGGNIDVEFASSIDELTIRKGGMINGFSLMNQAFYIDTVTNIRSANVYSGFSATLYDDQSLNKVYIYNGGTAIIKNGAYAHLWQIQTGQEK